ncbi:MAG: trypsin-like peptidase domain-containing protein [Defluviitaleaceae bacterium]|nr:trypsin-like peptidase domain-containing protein [Defluviitaleaceae bacterium]
MKKTKKMFSMFSMFLAFLMAFGLTATSFAQTNVETTIDHYPLYAEETPYVLGNDDLLPDLQRNTDRYFLSNACVSELPLESVFELFRVQVAIDLDMDLDTFLSGDIGEWSDNYLGHWRRENGIEEVSYDGEMYVRFNSETGGVDVHSMRTHEYLCTVYRSPEESDLMRKIALLRAPYSFHLGDARRDIDEYELIQLMDEALGIQSIDELMESLPLERLEEAMFRKNLSISDITYNWVDFEASDIHEMNTQNITPLSTQHTQVTNTTASQFRPVSHLEIVFPNRNPGVGTGFVFGAHNVVMTAGHNIFNNGHGGWVSHIIVSPGRSGTSTPYGRNRIDHEEWPSPWIIPWRWYNNADTNHDWGIIHAGHINIGGSRFWLTVGTDAELRNLETTVIGFPGGLDNHMFRSTGRSSLPTATRFNITNYTVTGYSGSPVLNPGGGVVGIVREQLNAINHGQAVRITPELAGWNYNMIF